MSTKRLSVKSLAQGPDNVTIPRPLLSVIAALIDGVTVGEHHEDQDQERFERVARTVDGILRARYEGLPCYEDWGEGAQNHSILNRAIRLRQPKDYLHRLDFTGIKLSFYEPIQGNLVERLVLREEVEVAP